MSYVALHRPGLKSLTALFYARARHATTTLIKMEMLRPDDGVFRVLAQIAGGGTAGDRGEGGLGWKEVETTVPNNAFMIAN